MSNNQPGPPRFSRDSVPEVERHTVSEDPDSRGGSRRLALTLALAVVIGAIVFAALRGGSFERTSPSEDAIPPTPNRETTAASSTPVLSEPLESEAESTVPRPTATAGIDGSESELTSTSRLEDCSRVEPIPIPASDRELLPLSLESELELRRQARLQVASEYQVSDDEATSAFLAELLTALQPPSRYEYAVTLLESSEVNAFAVAGGDIFFTTGIVAIMDDDEIASIMGHEIAHVHCRHIAKDFERRALAIATVEEALGLDIGDDFVNSDMAQFIESLISPTFSRADEREADLVGLDLLRIAGFPSAASVSAMEKFLALGGEESADRWEQFLATHPLSSERIEALEADIAVNG